MTAWTGWTLKKLAALAILGTLAALVYDWVMPVYGATRLEAIERRGDVLYGTLYLEKRRDREAIKGTLTATADWADQSANVILTDDRGDPFVLRDLPPREKPYRVRLGWRLEPAAPTPDAVGFALRTEGLAPARRHLFGPYTVTETAP